MNNERGKCEVCGKRTRSCIPSPFYPRSLWWCPSCYKNNFFPYKDLILVLCNCKSYKELLKRYPPEKDWDIREYIKSAINYYGVSKERLFKDAKLANKEWAKIKTREDCDRFFDFLLDLEYKVLFPHELYSTPFLKIKKDKNTFLKDISKKKR